MLAAARSCELQLREGCERIAKLADKLHAARDFSSPTRQEASLRTWNDLPPFDHSLASPAIQVKVTEASALLSAREERLSRLADAIAAWEAAQSASVPQNILTRLGSLNAFDIAELRGTDEKTLRKAQTLKERTDRLFAQQTALDVTALGWFIDVSSAIPSAIDVTALLREAVNAEGWRLVTDRMEADVILHLSGQERQSTTTVGKPAGQRRTCGDRCRDAMASGAPRATLASLRPVQGEPPNDRHGKGHKLLQT